MEQTYQYPNLLSGTRSGKGWTRIGSGAYGGYNPNTGIVLYNSKTTEVFLFSPPVVLHKGTDYTLHCFAASTANMSSTELWVLNVGGPSDNYNWIGAHPALRTPGPGGGVARCHVPAQCTGAGRSALPAPLRQQREHGRQELHHLVPQHHAHRGHEAACMGTGRRGGVAVDER